MNTIGMSPEDEYRYTGTLSSENIQLLLDSALDVGAIYAHLAEVETGFVNEDFLSEIRKAVCNLADSLRGSNKQTALNICEMIEQLEANIYLQVQYAENELRALYKLLPEE